jgi:hypothetical protein
MSELVERLLEQTIDAQFMRRGFKARNHVDAILQALGDNGYAITPTRPSPSEDVARPVEAWHRDRKVTIYPDSVLRVWGPNIHSEMSDEPRSHETVQTALDWLYGDTLSAESDAARLREALEPFERAADCIDKWTIRDSLTRDERPYSDEDRLILGPGVAVTVGHLRRAREARAALIGTGDGTQTNGKQGEQS